MAAMETVGKILASNFFAMHVFAGHGGITNSLLKILGKN